MLPYRHLGACAFFLLFLAGCGGAPVAPRTGSLTDARKNAPMMTKAAGIPPSPVDAPAPPFMLSHYESPVGLLAAYVTSDPGDGRKHPAILWITGGDCNSIGDVWSEAPANNDQTAGAFRKAGIVMMFPSLRGGNQNPGKREGFWGEVDDVLAARKTLAQLPYVDPARIYLGGHSTGGTLALLVSESSDQFRAVFSFGPVEDVRGYPGEYTPFDTSNKNAAELRSPGYWLHTIKSPTFVFEGTGGNIDALRTMSKSTSNTKVTFYPIPGDHFTILGPTNRLLAQKVLADTGATCNISFAADELARAQR